MHNLFLQAIKITKIGYFGYFMQFLFQFPTCTEKIRKLVKQFTTGKQLT